MKLLRVIPSVVIVVLVGLLIVAFIHIKNLKEEIDHFNQRITSLEKENTQLIKELADFGDDISRRMKKAMDQREAEWISRVRDAQDKIKFIEQDRTKERADFFLKLAEAYTRAKMFEEAIHKYEEFLAINPSGGGSPTYYNMGIIYDENIDQPEKAIVSYQKYLEKAPADLPIRNKIVIQIENCRKRIEQNRNKENKNK